MNKIKLIICFVLLLIFAVGCGSNDSGGSDATGASEATAESEGTSSSEETTEGAPATNEGGAYVVATQNLGTNFYMMTDALTSVVEPNLPEGTSFDVQTTSPGGVAASYILESGNADITIGSAAASLWATETGILGREPASGIRSIVGGLDLGVSVIVFTKDFADKTGFTTLEEVIEAEHPIRLAVKDIGSMGQMTSEIVLEEMGVTYDDIESWGGDVTLTDSSNVVDMLKDNRADLTIDHTTLNQANYNELTLTTDVYFAPISDEVLAGLDERGFARSTIPEGSYNNQVTEPIETFYTPTAMLVTESFPEEMAYLMAKSISENTEELIQKYPEFKNFDPETTCEPENTGVPLHAGAERYFAETGCVQ